MDGSKTSLVLFNELKKKSEFNILLIVVSSICSDNIIKKINTKKFKLIISDLKKRNSVLTNLLQNNEIHLVFSYYNFKVPEYILSKLSIGGINFHPSYLPYNKGRHSAFWGIYSDTLLGATAHWMTTKFDEGDIFLQKKIKYDLFPIASKVYFAQLQALEKIIKIVIKNISQGIFVRKKQTLIKGQYHFAKDILSVTKLNFNSEISTNIFLKILRGTNFPHQGFYIVKNKNEYKICSKIKIFKRKKLKINFSKISNIAKAKLSIREVFEDIEVLNKKIYLITYKNHIFKIKSKITKNEIQN